MSNVKFWSLPLCEECNNRTFIYLHNRTLFISSFFFHFFFLVALAFMVCFLIIYIFCIFDMFRVTYKIKNNNGLIIISNSNSFVRSAWPSSLSKCCKEPKILYAERFLRHWQHSEIDQSAACVGTDWLRSNIINIKWNTAAAGEVFIFSRASLTKNRFFSDSQLFRDTPNQTYFTGNYYTLYLLIDLLRIDYTIC